MKMLLTTLKHNGLLGWHTLYMWGRYCLIFTIVCLPTFLFRSKLGPCRKFVCLSSILELSLEHLFHYLVAVGTITRHECDGYISWMRSNDIAIYILAMTMSIVWSVVFGTSISTANNHDTKVAAGIGVTTTSATPSTTDMTILFQMNQVLHELTTKYEQEQNRIHGHLETMSRRGQELEQQMLAWTESATSRNSGSNIHQQSIPSFRNVSALVSPWSPTTKPPSSMFHRDAVQPNESLDYYDYRTPSHMHKNTAIGGHLPFNKEEDHHYHPCPNQHGSPQSPHSFTNPLVEPRVVAPSFSSSLLLLGQQNNGTAIMNHQQNNTYYKDDDSDSYDDCCSHYSLTTSSSNRTWEELKSTSIVVVDAYTNDSQDKLDDMNCGKRKRELTSSHQDGMPKKRQK